MRRVSAFRISDLPAPVSPVMQLREFPNSISTSSKTASEEI
jgi:hypothetical protein